MSRDGGFAIADIATGHFDDPKIRKLWRLLGDQDAMALAMMVHLALVLASWGAGRRVTVDEAVPTWLHPSPETLAALRSAGLIDRQSRLPRRSWDSWFGPAFERRELRREAGRSGGRAKAERRHGGALPVPSVPYRTVPSVPSVARDVRKVTTTETTFDQAMTANGVDPAIIKRERH